MTRRLSVVLAAVGIAIGCASCGIPASPSATAFNAQADGGACNGPKSINIYLVATVNNRERLQPVRRAHVARDGDEAICAINALNDGPTSDEVINGLSTAFVLPEGLTYLGENNGVAMVQLDAAFLSIAQPTKIYEAYGQIVYTLTGLGVGIDKVQFIFDNGPYLGVLLPGGGVAVDGIVGRQNYCSFGPPGQGCSSLSSGAKGTKASRTSG